jgi:hypothetical protein
LIGDAENIFSGFTQDSSSNSTKNLFKPHSSFGLNQLSILANVNPKLHQSGGVKVHHFFPSNL